MNKLLAKAGCCYDVYTAFKFIKRCLWKKETLLKKRKKKIIKIAYTLDQGRQQTNKKERIFC